MDRFSRDAIVRALEALANELAAPCEIAVVGGAALVLLYGARETTKDIDAVFLGGRTWISVTSSSR